MKHNLRDVTYVKHVENSLCDGSDVLKTLWNLKLRKRFRAMSHAAHAITNCVIYLNQDLQPSPGYQTSLPAVFFLSVKSSLHGNIGLFQG